MAKKSQIDEILEVVIHIKDVMATKEELMEVKKELSNQIFAIEGKLGGINNRIDNEVDHRKVMNVRVDKLEKKVFK